MLDAANYTPRLKTLYGQHHQGCDEGRVWL